MIQDQELNYWFSTNEGIIFYDHYTYTSIDCPDSRSISFFNFVMNQNGIIFCNNLNNQIYSIQNGRCELFYELKPDETSTDVNLITTSENHLMVCGKKMIVISENGQVLNRHVLKPGYIGLPFITSDHRIIYSISGEDSLICYEGGSFSHQPIVHDHTVSIKNVLQFFQVDTVVYAMNLTSKELFKFDDKEFRLTAISSSPLFERSQSIRLYTGQKSLWAAGTLPGLIQCDPKNLPEKAGLFYSDVFVSDVYEDKEGNMLISTFDHGVYVITDMNRPDLIKPYPNDPVVLMLADRTFDLLLGTSTGKIVSYQHGSFQELHTQGKRPIEVIVNLPESPFLIFDDGHIRILNKENLILSNILQASLKDGVIVSDELFYLCTNTGLLKCQTTANYTQVRYEFVPGLEFRNYAIEHDRIHNLLYISTVNGLFTLDSTGNVNEIKHEGKVIFSSTLHSHKDLIYAPLPKSGILIMKNGKITDKIEPEIKSKKAIIFKLMIYEESIFALTDEGVCQFDFDGTFLRSYNQEPGESNLRILDFLIRDRQLFISKPNGIQVIDLDEKQIETPVPQLFLRNVLANDEEIQFDSIFEFASDTRKFKFILSSPTLKHKSEIRYFYKLNGYDEDWLTQDYANNEILYNALAPGEYEFLAKAENSGQFSEIVRYNFAISRPFYATIWFISVSIFIFLMIVFWIYRRQLKQQQIKANQINELNASKLTAIQSQMNPHFIFNSLNSIQDLILKGDVENSYSYITTFSNLVRRTLTYSDKDFIEFEEEIKLLELYLSLEKLRFKRDFSYSLEGKDISDIRIPPMLIQPFIENALVHGLLHKEGKKELRIRFTLNEHLICIVEDNGIGRLQAKKIKERQRSDHESFSVQAIRRRFEILAAHYQGGLGYFYEDLEENGVPSGTRVIIRIPVKHNY